MPQIRQYREFSNIMLSDFQIKYIFRLYICTEINELILYWEKKTHFS